MTPKPTRMRVLAAAATASASVLSEWGTAAARWSPTKTPSRPASSTCRATALRSAAENRWACGTITDTLGLAVTEHRRAWASPRHRQQGLADGGTGFDRRKRGGGLGQGEFLANDRPDAARGCRSQRRPGQRHKLLGAKGRAGQHGDLAGPG